MDAGHDCTLAWVVQPQIGRPTTTKIQPTRRWSQAEPLGHLSGKCIRPGKPDISILLRHARAQYGVHHCYATPLLAR